MSDLNLSRRQLHAACDAWGRTPDTGGGTLGLGLWLSKHKPHFTVADYADLVAMVRAEIGDDTDYSTYPRAELARLDQAQTQINTAWLATNDI